MKKKVDEERSTKSKVMTVLLGVSLFCVFSLLLLAILDKGYFFGRKSSVEPKSEEKPKEDKSILVENEDYYIKDAFTGQYLDLTKRGYYIDTLNEPNSPYFYIICMGEKNTGGYSLKVKEVTRIDGKTEIIVEEIEPPKDAMVTMAFTYPKIIVEFPTYQDNIVITNTNGVEFPLLTDY